MDNDRVISTINDLIETCRDGQNGFREAAENVKSTDLKSIFNQISMERAQFVGELQQLVRSLGGDPEKTGSTSAAVHRAWIDIKGSLTGRDEKDILSECERGEDSAVDTYQDALKEDLPTSIRSIIDRQYISIKDVHDRIRQMRDARSAGAGH